MAVPDRAHPVETSGLNGRPCPVLVCAHALDRCLERYPELRRWGRTELADLVRRDVVLALEQGRVSCTEPRFHVGLSYRRRRLRFGRRFAWTVDHSRVYVLRRRRAGRRLWQVVTALPRVVPERHAA